MPSSDRSMEFLDNSEEGVALKKANIYVAKCDTNQTRRQRYAAQLSGIGTGVF